MEKKNEKEQQDIQYQIGQTVYGAKDCTVMRYEILEIVHKLTSDGAKVELTVQEIDGRKTSMPISSALKTLEEAKKLANANLEMIYKNIKSGLDELADEKFDEIIEERKKASQQKPC